MKKCDGCGTEFDDSVELFPRLIMTKEDQVARKLAEREDEEELLCLGCWLEAIDNLEKKQLAMLLLGMLRKINYLEERLSRAYTYPGESEGLLEKMKRYNPPSRPYTTSPNTGPIWVSPPDPQKYSVGDFPKQYPKTVCMSSGGFSNAVKHGETYLCGSWATKVH